MLMLGAMRAKIVVQRRTDVQDAVGEPIPTWNTHATRRAEVVSDTADERFTAGTFEAEQTVAFRCHYDPTLAAITPRDRISYDSRTFDVLGVTNVGERNEEIVIRAKEVLA